MIRTVVLPIALFVASSFLAVMSLHAAGVSFVGGLGLCAYAVVRARRAATQMPGPQSHPRFMASTEMRAGVALAVAPVITVILVLTAMSGLFGHR
jgi:uncharacterized membrane protein YidH (DUF202 family)